MSLKWLWLFFWLTGPTNQNRFNSYVFSTIWMKFGMWTAIAPALLLLLPCSCIAPGVLLACSQPAPGLLMVCSCLAPDPAHSSFAAFIIISTLRLFSARRESPFMVLYCMLWSWSWSWTGSYRIVSCGCGRGHGQDFTVLYVVVMVVVMDGIVLYWMLWSRLCSCHKLCNLSLNQCMRVNFKCSVRMWL